MAVSGRFSEIGIALFWSFSFAISFIVVFVLISFGTAAPSVSMALPIIFMSMSLCVLCGSLALQETSSSSTSASRDLDVSLRDFVGYSSSSDVVDVEVHGERTPVNRIGLSHNERSADNEARHRPPPLPPPSPLWGLHGEECLTEQRLDISTPPGMAEESPRNWQVLLDTGWRDFAGVEQQVMNAARSRGEATALLRARGQLLEVRFNEGVQVNTKTGKKRPIRQSGGGPTSLHKPTLIWQIRMPAGFRDYGIEEQKVFALAIEAGETVAHFKLPGRLEFYEAHFASGVQINVTTGKKRPIRIKPDEQEGDREDFLEPVNLTRFGAPPTHDDGLPSSIPRMARADEFFSDHALELRRTRTMDHMDTDMGKDATPRGKPVPPGGFGGLRQESEMQITSRAIDME